MSNVTSLRMRVLPRYPARISGATGLAVVSENPDLVIKPDFGALAEILHIDVPATTFSWWWNKDNDSYGSISFENLLANIQEVVIGENLTGLSEIVSGADKVPYFIDSAGNASAYTVSEYVRTISGAVDDAAFRASLGLGTSAPLDVGTTAGTVAAGDDTRIEKAESLLTGMTTVFPYMVESRRMTDVGFQVFINAPPYEDFPAFGPATIHGRASGNLHGVLGEVYQGNAPGDWSYPCGVTGAAVLDSPGNSAFGLFGRVDLRSNGTGTHELNTFNYVGGPPGNYPPDRSFGITHPMPITLTLAAGGNFPSMLALDICREGSEPQPFYTGIYTRPDAVTDFGIIVDSDAANGPKVGAYLKNRMATSESAALTLQSVGGSPAAGSKFLKILNPGGSTLVSFDPSGSVAIGEFAQATPTRLNVSGSDLVRGIDNTAAMFGITQNAENALGACIQIGSITGSFPFIAASRYGASEGVASPLVLMTDATERFRILATPGNGIGLKTPVPANSYVDDAAAEAAGVGIGEWYRNGSNVQMRAA